LLYQDQSRAASKAFTRANALGLTARHYWYQHDALKTWNRTGQYQQTIRVAAAALKGYPNSFEINGFYAVALEQVRQYKKALAAWQAAYKEDPNSSQVGVAIRRLTKKISAL
jgi:tetratricopeptide (TPR) repeat protein